MLIIREKRIPKYLDEQDFVLVCLTTCEGNLWGAILGCIIQGNFLAGVAVLVA